MTKAYGNVSIKMQCSFTNATFSNWNEMPSKISQQILELTVFQVLFLTGISVGFNLLYTIPLNTYICFMSFSDPVSYSNTQITEFPSPLANNNILFMIPSAFPSWGFILALLTCIQRANHYVLFACARQGVCRGQAKLFTGSPLSQHLQRTKLQNPSEKERKEKSPLIFTLLHEADELQGNNQL